MEAISKKEATIHVQDESLVTYCYKINKKDSYLNFKEDAVSVMRKIQAYNFNPGAKCIINGEIVKILEARVEKNLTCIKKSSVCIDDQLLISCKDQAIRLLKIQRAGKKIMLAKEALNGWLVKKGTLINEKW